MEVSLSITKILALFNTGESGDPVIDLTFIDPVVVHKDKGLAAAVS